MKRPRQFGRPLRAVAIGIAVLVVSAIAWFSICEYRNSRDVPPPSEAELRDHFRRATGWIFANSAHIATENNPMLWVFVQEAGRLTDDTHLLALANDYQARYMKGSLSRFLFNSRGIEEAGWQHIVFPDNWHGYQRLFVYATTCNSSAREDPEVLALLNPSACDARPEGFGSLTCHTHQLMGLRYIQKNRCDATAETAQWVDAVQNSILAELHWDFRIEDAYIQKVMMLVESGRAKDVKPVWIERILAAQRSDGGWDGAGLLAHLPGNRALVWGGRLYPSIKSEPTSNLHATAQGLYLLALLLNSQRTPEVP